MWQSVVEFAPELLKGTQETLYMTFLSTLFAYVFGLPLGVLVVLTDRDGIAPQRAVHTVFGWIIDIGRSIPFLILMLAIIPFTRLVVGKSIGSTAAIVPLVVAAVPFVARMVETSLKELDHSVMESAVSMGATGWQIIYKVLLPECVPSLVRGVSITTITLIGYSAMAGAVGGGGLGDLAVRYGYHRYREDVMVLTVLLLIVLVVIIQAALGFLAKKIDKRNK